MTPCERTARASCPPERKSYHAPRLDEASTSARRPRRTPRRRHVTASGSLRNQVSWRRAKPACATSCAPPPRLAELAVEDGAQLAHADRLTGGTGERPASRAAATSSSAPAAQHLVHAPVDALVERGAVLVRDEGDQPVRVAPPALQSSPVCGRAGRRLSVSASSARTTRRALWRSSARRRRARGDELCRDLSGARSQRSSSARRRAASGAAPKARSPSTARR